MNFNEPVSFKFGSTITHMFTFGYMHFNTCMHFTIAVIMSVFSSPIGSPGHPDVDQTYPMSLSDDLRQDRMPYMVCWKE